ncbi:hypothetical protein Tco_0897108 [Tanacetum coccineum]
METSTEKVKNPNLENAVHVPPPGEEDSFFMEIPNPKAKKTVNVEMQDLNSPKPNSYQSRLPYPERMKVREHDKPRVDCSLFLRYCVVNFAAADPRVPIILGRPFLRIAKALIDLYEEKSTLRVGKEELVYYADKYEKNKEKNFVQLAISSSIFQRKRSV